MEGRTTLFAGSASATPIRMWPRGWLLPNVYIQCLKKVHYFMRAWREKTVALPECLARCESQMTDAKTSPSALTQLTQY